MLFFFAAVRGWSFPFTKESAPMGKRSRKKRARNGGPRNEAARTQPSSASTPTGGQQRPAADQTQERSVSTGIRAKISGPGSRQIVGNVIRGFDRGIDAEGEGGDWEIGRNDVGPLTPAERERTGNKFARRGPQRVNDAVRKLGETRRREATPRGTTPDRPQADRPASRGSSDQREAEPGQVPEPGEGEAPTRA